MMMTKTKQPSTARNYENKVYGPWKLGMCTKRNDGIV